MSEYEKGCVNVSTYEKLEKENAGLIEAINMLSSVIDDDTKIRVEDRVTINVLCDALETLCIDFEDYADPREPFDYKAEIAKHRALVKQYRG